jgi:hypothetical protein
MNYESAGGNLTINTWNTTVSTGARTLRLSGAGNGEIVNWTSASNNVVTVIKDDAGTWSLRSTMNPGLRAAVFGPVTVNNGTLAVDGGLGERVTGSVVVNNGGTLQVGASGGTVGEVGAGVTPTSVTIKSGGALNASTFTDYSLQPAQTLIAGGSISTGGQLSVFGDNRVHIGDVSTASAGTMSVTGNLSLSNQFAATGGGLYFDLSNSTSGTNDKVNVSGNVSVSNGPVNLYVNALGGGFATGTYNLISYTGAALNTSDFNLSVTGAARPARPWDSAPSPTRSTWSSAAPPAISCGRAISAAIGTSSEHPIGLTPAHRWPTSSTSSTTSPSMTPPRTATSTSRLRVTPGSMTVTTGGNYTFGGSGTITSAAALTKNGTGTLVVTKHRAEFLPQRQYQRRHAGARHRWGGWLGHQWRHRQQRRPRCQQEQHRYLQRHHLRQRLGH